MIVYPSILADGLPIPLIIGGVFVLLWALDKLFGSSPSSGPASGKSTGTPFDPADLRKIRDRELRTGQQPSGSEKPRGRGKQKVRKETKPPPLPSAVAAQVAFKSTPPPPAAVPSVVRHKPPSAETTRAVNLLLEAASIRDAVILNEIIGKPKALRDE